MDRHEKLLRHILMRKGDANVPFEALCQLLRRLRFQERIRGDHHVFSREDIPEILNLQPKGAQAKVYQVKQVRDVIIRHGLKLEE